ncbi:MAG TPA: mercury(II) reductase [Ktedonobacteraceae bacterium]|nr:mercury(II) reductase [Ktedonobacteraceae bacterium]
MNTTQENYDLVILGSGSTAFAAALHAVELGKTVAMTEERTVGGTCANRGCLPSKNLIEAARLVYDAAHPRYPGLSPVSMPVNWAELIAQKDEIIQQYRVHKYESLLDHPERIQVVPGRACLVSEHTVEVRGVHDVRHLIGEQVLIATGSTPGIPSIAGLAGVPYLTSDLLSSTDDPWKAELRAQPRSLLILGGGYIALELGQMFARFGTEVTLVTRGTSILTGYEPEIAEALTSLLQEEGLRIVTSAQVRGVERAGEGVILSALRHGCHQTFTADKLLIATGRRPNTQELGLEQAGVEVDAAGAIRVDRTLQTSVSYIWAAGDVIGRETESQMATPVGARDGKIAAHNALSGEPLREVDHTVIPRVIFTDPQVAVVGLTDEEAVAAGIACDCNTISLSVVPRAGAIRDTRGVIKMVLDGSTRRVVGVSMLGMNAGEVIHEAAMALRFGATTDDFIDLIHVYPTMAEALKLVAISFTKDVNRLSCCAS